MDPDSDYGGDGGDGGAIYNTGTLTIISSTLKDNRAGDGSEAGYGGYGGNGGAICNIGKLTITSSTINDNIAGDGGAGYLDVGSGGDGGEGGAIYNTGTLTITRSALQNNTVGYGERGYDVGGAIFNTGTFTITHSTINDNRAGYMYQWAGEGDAIFNNAHNSVYATYNWWGSNSGPSAKTIYGKVTVKPWLTEPVIVLTSPKNGATGFSRTAVIAIKFSENIKSSINWSKIELSNSGGHHVVITRSIAGNTIIIKAKSIRTANSWYVVTIPASAVKDYYW